MHVEERGGEVFPNRKCHLKLGKKWVSLPNEWFDSSSPGQDIHQDSLGQGFWCEAIAAWAGVREAWDAV